MLKKCNSFVKGGISPLFHLDDQKVEGITESYGKQFSNQKKCYNFFKDCCLLIYVLEGNMKLTTKCGKPYRSSIKIFIRRP